MSIIQPTASKKIFNISLKDSYVVGDRWRDLGAGKKAGCKTIFINREYREKNPYKPDFTVKSIKKILNILHEKN